MTQDKLTMNVEARKTGKGASIAYRNDRKVPAVIYGPKMKNMNCLIEEIFVVKHSSSRHESAIFQTQSDEKGLSGMKVMLKKIDTHPGSNRPIHVDLYALDMTAKIKVHINIEFEGKAAGEAEGGVLQVVLRDVEIECNPTDIPESIKVDISGLGVGDSIHISDLSFGPGIQPMTDPTRTVCLVSIPKDEPAEPVVAEGEEGAAPAADGAKAEGGDSAEKKDS